MCNEECIGRIFGRLTQLSCTVNIQTAMEDAMKITKLEKTKNVVVIGAGPGDWKRRAWLLCAAAR